MASPAFVHRRFRSGLCIWQWMMAKGEEPPAVGTGKPLTVFHRNVDPVVLAIEKATSGWFLARAVRENRIKDPGQLFDKYCSFRKRARRQIRINIFLLDVHVMIFREACLSVVERVGCLRSSDENP